MNKIKRIFLLFICSIFVLMFTSCDKKVNLKRNYEQINITDDKYRNYYETVGPRFIRANSFQESEIKKEWRRKLSNQLVSDKLSEEIYNTFEVNKRYVKSDIKNTLKGIYDKLGYKKTAKATDLNAYFYMKSILTPDKKHGFEILAKR